MTASIPLLRGIAVGSSRGPQIVVDDPTVGFDVFVSPTEELPARE